MKRIFLSIFALCCIIMTASALKVYINPGHGDWDQGARPMATINYPTGSNGFPDTLGFYESNTNLWKCFYLQKKLQSIGVSVKMSRTATGPYPRNSSNQTYNKALSTIASEAENYACDHFISVHSNAATEGTNTNYALILYRGTTGSPKVSGSDAMSKAVWDGLVTINRQGFEYYTAYASSRNVVGDLTFYGKPATNTGYLGVLKHSRPGYLTEGYFHTYQPSRHRGLNPDWCCQEGLRYFRGIVNYHGLTKDTKGYIMGEIKDKSKSLTNNLYKYNSNTTDKYYPINGAKVILKDSKGNVIKTNCYPYVKKMLKNQNYYTTDHNYNGIFVFENLTPGTYTYSVHKSGYKDATGTLTVTANNTTYTTIYMTAGTGSDADDHLDPVEPDVKWVLNGGKVPGGTVPTNAELWEDFKTYYKTFYNENRADQEITGASTFMTQGYKIMTDASSKYKWLGTYINSVAAAQGYTIGEDEASWRWHVHSFFNCNQHTTWPQTADFSTAGKPSAWGATYQNAMGTSATLPEFIESTYTIPTPIKDGYTFLGWYNTNNTSGTKYTTLSAGFKGTLYAIWQEIPTGDVTWVLNGGTVSGTLPTVITSTYTIPTPTKTGAIFVGWYDTNNTSGNKLTTLAAGYKGTVYAIWRDPKVTWVLNGGKVYEIKTSGGSVTVPTNDSLWQAFKPYYNKFYNLSRADQPITGVSSFAAALMYKIMTDASSEYKWLGDYINSVATAQGYTLGEDEALWRWHVHSFFNCNKHETWPVTADFSEAGKPEKWGPAYQKAHGGDATGGTTTKVEVTLPSKITTTYTIPTPEKEGHTFVGWYNNNEGTGTALKTLPAYYDGTVYAIWKTNEPTDVTWELNGGTVSVTLPTKIEGSAYTLPTPTKTGYVFLGWFDNAAGTGSALTSLPVGYKGTVYAIWREAKVTWVLNGGKVYEIKTTTSGGSGANVTVPTNDSLWQAFKPYYNTYYSLNRADQPITSVSSFAAALMCKIMTDPASEYKWLGDYVNSVATAQGFTLGEDEALWRWHVHSFFNCNKHETWPVTADFSEAGKPEKWGPAYQAAHGGSSTGGTTTTTKVEVTLPSKITAPYTIPTPEKEGATFLGWYDTNNTTGTKLTVLPAYYDGTIYAIWSETTTDVEQVERPLLDINAPMYDVLGRQVNDTYRGIVIQNGQKYLLR